ncbi:MAG: hypothetical protein AB7O73_00175, partial [Bacteroidia bacterium]
MKKRLGLLFIFFLTVNFTGFAQYSCQDYKLKSSQIPPYYSEENLRSDTFDVFRYEVHLEVGNFSTKDIKGHTQIKFAPKMSNQNSIRFDLLKMQIDSVKEGSTHLTYNYNDTLLRVLFSATKNINDTSYVNVYYHGQPVTDNSGWGGFYFDNHGGNEYAYNLGVGFQANPHNYGRV